MDNGALPQRKSPKFERSGSASFQRPPVPPELIETIIDMLHMDRTALATCALVCRSWLPRTRYHLFSEVIITRRNDAVISKLLSSSTCAITSAVKHLVLQTIDNLDQRICRLSNVTQMSLYRFNASRTPVFPPINLIPLLRNLESLHIERVSFDWQGVSLLALLRQCSQLQSLSCYSIRNANEDAAQSQRLHELEAKITPRLRSLTIHAGVRPFLLAWFGSWWKSAAPPLMKLDLQFRNLADLDDSMSLFEAVGSGLQVLRICVAKRDLGEWLRQRSICLAIDAQDYLDWRVPITRCLTQLQSLSIDYGRSCSVHFVIEALRNLPSLQLQELTITLPLVVSLWVIGDSITIFSTWSELDSLLENPQFVSTLRILAIRFRHPELPTDAPFCTELENMARTRFPSSAARGILRVRFLE
jgi:hypothetical protein